MRRSSGKSSPFATRAALSQIADATRWMRKLRNYDSIEDTLRSTAALYRKALWRDATELIEVWAEKDALAGLIYPVTEQYDVPLMVTRGFSSEALFRCGRSMGGQPAHISCLLPGRFRSVGP